MNRKLPYRKALPHEVPPWVDPQAPFFITICTAPKGENQLCHADRGTILLDAAAYYHSTARWHLTLFLLMPDHVHMLAAFPEDPGMQPTIAAWKRYTARKLGITWQRDFFDHRLRGSESVEQKAEYIRDNPVRAELVARPEEWPYVFDT